MPPAVGTAIAGVATAGAGIYGAKKQAKTSQQASQIESRSNAAQLDFLKQQAEEDRRRYDEQVAAEKAQWDAEQTRRAPYRAAAASILSHTMGGMPVPAYQPSFAPSAGQYAPGTIGNVAGRTPGTGYMPPTSSAPRVPTTAPLQAPQFTIRDYAEGRY